MMGKIEDSHWICVPSWFLLCFFKARCSGRKERQLGSSVIEVGKKEKEKEEERG